MLHMQDMQDKLAHLSPPIILCVCMSVCVCGGGPWVYLKFHQISSKQDANMHNSHVAHRSSKLTHFITNAYTLLPTPLFAPCPGPCNKHSTLCICNNDLFTFHNAVVWMSSSKTRCYQCDSRFGQQSVTVTEYLRYCNQYREKRLCWLTDSELSVHGWLTTCFWVWQHQTSWWACMVEETTHLMAAGP